MHAMVSISILVECGAIVTGTIIAIAGKENIAIAQAIAYGICSVAVSLGVISFLGERNVSLQDVVRWPSLRSPPARVRQLVPGSDACRRWGHCSRPRRPRLPRYP